MFGFVFLPTDIGCDSTSLPPSPQAPAAVASTSQVEPCTYANTHTHTYTKHTCTNTHAHKHIYEYCTHIVVRRT